MQREKKKKTHCSLLPYRITERRQTAAGDRSCKPHPWIGMTNQQFHPGLVFGELTHAAPTFPKGLSPASFGLYSV